MKPRFRAGDFTTNYLPETYPDGFQPFGGKLSNTEINHLAGIAAVLYCKDQQRSREILNDQNVKNQRTMITSLDLTVKIAGESIRVSNFAKQTSATSVFLYDLSNYLYTFHINCF